MQKNLLLNSKASGRCIIESLSINLQVFMESSLIYKTLRLLLKKEPKPYIERLDAVPSDKGGPSKKVYQIADESKKVLEGTVQHHEALVIYFRRQPQTNP